MADASFLPGHIFASRFRITEVRGVGHTAEVYVATDTSLQRTVIVKTLVPALEQYEDIRRSFRSRVVAMANLSHPHVARVFDGGQEGGHIFMVGEYLDGGSLEDQLQRGVTYSPAMVARLGRDIASALAALHAHGVVHGELSPSKILFDREGSLRVSDPAMSGLGVAFRSYVTADDVRYFSPEQARGDVASAATDVYALALLLFEAATGQSPFPGHSAEATLRARTIAPLPSRPELGTLDLLLAQATVPDPTQRLSAEAFAQRLSTVVEDADDFILPREESPSLLSSFTPAEPRTSVGFVPPSPLDIVGGRTPVTTDGGNDPLGILPAYSTSARRRRRPGYLVAAVAVIVLAVAAGGAWKFGYFTTKHTVPSLEGLTIAQATALVQGDGLTLNLNGRVSSQTVGPNEIVSQSPAAGSQVTSGSTLNVVVSSGQALVTLPVTLVGSTCASAIVTLAHLGVHAICPPSAAVTSATVPAHHVVSVHYRTSVNPLAVPNGSSVTLVVSAGRGGSTTTTTPVSHKGQVKVPSLVGLSRAQVFAAMQKALLYFSTRGPGAGTSAWRQVTSTSPAAGTWVAVRSSVVLFVKE